MPQPPLSYLSSLCVFPYLDASRRFALAAKCPSLRGVHKQAPLNIDQLVLKETCFVLNGLVYRFRTVLKRRNGENLNFTVERDNSRGGVPHDVDEFGRRDGNCYLEKGDFQIGRARIREPVHDLADQLNEENDDRNRRGLPPIAFIDPENHNSQQENVIARPTYVAQTNCSFFQERRKLGTVNFPEGFTIRNALRFTLKNLFDAKHPVHVKHLDINVLEGALRLPSSIRLITRMLTVTGPVFTAIKSMLHPGLMFTSMQAAQEPVTKFIGFEQLTIENWAMLDAAEALIRVSTKNIHLSGVIVVGDDVSSLIQNWMKTPRPIGTQFTINSESGIEVLRSVWREMNVPFRDFLDSMRYKTTKVLKLATRPDQELIIYAEKDPENQLCEWTMVMEEAVLGTTEQMNN